MGQRVAGQGLPVPARTSQELPLQEKTSATGPMESVSSKGPPRIEVPVVVVIDVDPPVRQSRFSIFSCRPISVGVPKLQTACRRLHNLSNGLRTNDGNSYRSAAVVFRYWPMVRSLPRRTRRCLRFHTRRKL